MSDAGVASGGLRPAGDAQDVAVREVPYHRIRVRARDNASVGELQKPVRAESEVASGICLPPGVLSLRQNRRRACYAHGVVRGRGPLANYEGLYLKRRVAGDNLVELSRRADDKVAHRRQLCAVGDHNLIAFAFGFHANAEARRDDRCGGAGRDQPVRPAGAAYDRGVAHVEGAVAHDGRVPVRVDSHREGVRRHRRAVEDVEPPVRAVARPACSARNAELQRSARDAQRAAVRDRNDVVVVAVADVHVLAARRGERGPGAADEKKAVVRRTASAVRIGHDVARRHRAAGVDLEAIAMAAVVGDLQHSERG